MLRFLDFLGYWKWPNILAITLIPVLFFFLSWKPALRPTHFDTTILGPEQVGPWVVVVGTNARQPFEPGADVSWRIRFCSGCYEQIRALQIAFGDAERPVWSATPLSGDPHRLSATLRMPRAIPKKGSYLWLVLEAWDGQRYTISRLLSRGL